MKTYIVKFADRRKKDQTILAHNKKEAINIALKKYVCGFVVYNK